MNFRDVKKKQILLGRGKCRGRSLTPLKKGQKRRVVEANKFGGLKTNKSVSLKQYFSVKEVCDYFSISKDTVYRLIREGLLPRIKIRSSNRISIKEVKKLEKRLKVDEFA